MTRFNITSTTQVESAVESEGGEIIPQPQVGSIEVRGELTGQPNRELTLIAADSSSLGFTFKEWIIETSPLNLVPVTVGGYTQTIQEMCNPQSLQTELSNQLYTDGDFFYEDIEGDRVARSGYYGAGTSTYYEHDTARGIAGPFICGQNPNTGGTGGTNQSGPSTGGNPVGPGDRGIEVI